MRYLITLVILISASKINVTTPLTLEQELNLVVDQVELTLGRKIPVNVVKFAEVVNNDILVNAGYSDTFKTILVKREFFKNASPTARIAVIAHEVGHALGHSHTEDGLMHADTYETIQAVEIMGLKTALNNM